MTSLISSRRRARALLGFVATALIVCTAAGAAAGDPKAEDDFVTTTVGVPVSFNVFANDFDPDGGSLRMDRIGDFTGADPLLLALSVDGLTGDVVVEPRAPHTGILSFQYVVIDEEGDVAKARAFVSVRATDVPTVQGQGVLQSGAGRTSFELAGGPVDGGFAGSFQLQRFRGANISFVGDVVESLAGTGPNATMTGKGTWNGSPGYSFTVQLVEKGAPGGYKGDLIGVEIRDPSGAVVFTTGGTIRILSGNVLVT
jgi:Big-like domain-containing protein